ncbi:hypothetical protein L2E82_35270 [Cichorium intybus]|uniref:Uncharacterized protein n=1 Tax=Cichorium intybus TaxID=13427 RepID=A0ACB9BNI6_CICIN|nr:hypothetical protein L2E82_35270 [Cichorium intybus]
MPFPTLRSPFPINSPSTFTANLGAGVAYYRRAMVILLVYDVTDESSVFFSIRRDLKQRLAETDTNAETIKITQQGQISGSSESAQKSVCCGS